MFVYELFFRLKIPLMKPSYHKQLQRDSVLKPYLSLYHFELELKKHIHIQFIKSIVSQQLSTKVADVIFNRFKQLLVEENSKPQTIAQLTIDEFRSIGISNSKANYILNVCNFFIQEKLTDSKIYAMSDEECLKKFTSIKGIGKWTVEMILMFSLQSENIFPVDDLGIQQAMMQLYGLSNTNKKEMQTKMIEISNSWNPYKTYASLYLWKIKDSQK